MAGEEEALAKQADESLRLDGDEGKSAPITSPTWKLDGHEEPLMYVYEGTYVTDGQVDDKKEFPDMKEHFCNTPARLIPLRGPEYLQSDKTNNMELKKPGKTAAYTMVGMKVFQAPNALDHAAQTIMPLKAFMAELKEYDKTQPSLGGDAPMYLVFCWNFSNFFKTEHTCVVHLARRNIKIDSSETGDDPALDRALSRFMKLDKEGKNNKLKFVPRFCEQNGAIQAAIDMCGGERPVLIGNRIETSYYEGDGYLEVDFDVGSKTITSMLNGVMLKASGDVTYDECFLIEGQQQDELPERALFCVRWNHCCVENCHIKLDAMGNLKV